MKTLLTDKSPAVRVAAVELVCHVLDSFWELIPSPTIGSLIAALVDQTVRDMSSIAVRVAVLRGLGKLCNHPLAQPVLKAALPRVSACLNDSSARVRAAMVDLLLIVRGVRAIKFYDIAPLDSLLESLVDDEEQVARKIAKLLIPSYIPVSKSPEVALERVCSLLEQNKLAGEKLLTWCIQEGTPAEYMVHVLGGFVDGLASAAEDVERASRSSKRARKSTESYFESMCSNPEFCEAIMHIVMSISSEILR